jgi:hypothetical protein
MEPATLEDDVWAMKSLLYMFLLFEANAVNLLLKGFGRKSGPCLLLIDGAGYSFTVLDSTDTVESLPAKSSPSTADSSTPLVVLGARGTENEEEPSLRHRMCLD